MEMEFQGLEGLTSWMEKREPLCQEAAVIHLNEAWHQATLETDALFRRLHTLEEAFARVYSNHLKS